MKLTYLGTAAAEGFPALFCNCDFCAEARRLGGKNIRTRSQSLINNDLLIDFPADTYHHLLQQGIEGDTIPFLLITHGHGDHLYPTDLHLRHGAYAHKKRAPVLQIFCSGKTAERVGTPPNTEVNVLTPFAPAEIGHYTVTPLPARHMPGGEPLFYIIRDNNEGKTLLYAHDTGYFFEEVFDHIAANGIVFDMVSLDCTNMDIAIPDTGSHMGFPNLGRVLERLADLGAVTEKTVKYVNHFSHNGNPLQHVLEARAAAYGCAVSYDGCTVEF